MGAAAVVRSGYPVVLLAAVSCLNASPVGNGFGTDNLGPSGDGGGARDGGHSSANHSPSSTNEAGTSDAAPSQTNLNEAGPSQPKGRDGAAGHQEGGGSPPDASVSTADATAVDAATADVTITQPDAAICTTPNIGCMLSPPPSTGDIRQDCVNRINQFRTQCACVPPLQRWTDGEACADLEAQYDSQQMSPHAGFKQTNTACSQGSSMWASCCSTGMFARPLANAQDECPNYPNTDVVISNCLQQMWNEGPPPNGVQACMNDPTCFQMYGHFINMSSTTSTKVACGFSSTSGPLWAAQNFAP
jgi:hypothetical protein